MKAVFSLTLILFLFACTKESAPVQEVYKPVRYEKVTSLGDEQSRTFSGVSKAATETKLSFRIGGILTDLNVKVGDQVKRGQLIAAIDNSDDQLKYEQSKTSLENSRVQMEYSKANLDRVRKLFESNSVSLNDYEGAKNQFDNANATFQSNQRSLDLQQRQIGYSRLSSPISGIVTMTGVEINENIQPGQEIVILNSGDEIEVSTGIPESYINLVKKGAEAVIEFSSLSGKEFKGKVTEVSFAIEAESSTYPVTLGLNVNSAQLRPGMPARVTFDFSSQVKEENYPMAPSHTVLEDNNGRFVFTVIDHGDGFGIVERKAVKVGSLTGERYQILEGLEVGNLLITAGISKLSKGMKVRLLPIENK